MRVPEKNLIVSSAAIERLKQVLSTKPINTFLRVELTPGGCQGFNVKFSLDSNLAEDDRVFESNGVRVVCDETSLDIVNGSTVEYSSNLMGKYFWLNVSKAKNKCSCGSSFSF